MCCNMLWIYLPSDWKTSIFLFTFLIRCFVWWCSPNYIVYRTAYIYLRKKIVFEPKIYHKWIVSIFFIMHAYTIYSSFIFLSSFFCSCFGSLIFFILSLSISSSFSHLEKLKKHRNETKTIKKKFKKMKTNPPHCSCYLHHHWWSFCWKFILIPFLCVIVLSTCPLLLSIFILQYLCMVLLCIFLFSKPVSLQIDRVLVCMHFPALNLHVRDRCLCDFMVVPSSIRS